MRWRKDRASDEVFAYNHSLWYNQPGKKGRFESLGAQTHKDLYPQVLILNEGELSNSFEADRKLCNGE